MEKNLNTEQQYSFSHILTFYAAVEIERNLFKQFNKHVILKNKDLIAETKLIN